jgi:hypothetical protein
LKRNGRHQKLRLLIKRETGKPKGRERMKQ